MRIVILIIVALIICLIAVLLVFKRKKTAKILEQSLDNINGQIVVFNSEYANILKHYVSESEENDFVEKWNNLYSNVSKYHLSNKNNAYAGILQFKETYK